GLCATATLTACGDDDGATSSSGPGAGGAGGAGTTSAVTSTAVQASSSASSTTATTTTTTTSTGQGGAGGEGGAGGGEPVVGAVEVRVTRNPGGLDGDAIGRLPLELAAEGLSHAGLGDVASLQNVWIPGADAWVSYDGRAATGG